VTWHGLKGDSKNLFYASAAKLFGTPLLAIAIGLLFGLEGTLLGILIMMVAAPTAAASYVMVRAMGGNHGLAAGIISVTTLGSIVSVTALLASLRTFGLI
jgi:predicted permease